jgi:predicted Zn-dependent protease
VECESQLCRGRTVVDVWRQTGNEPNASVGYRELAIAFARKGDQANADLSSAQSAFNDGDFRTARQLATRAQKGFPVGSPGWIKSDDIVNFKPPKIGQN